MDTATIRGLIAEYISHPTESERLGIVRDALEDAGWMPRVQAVTYYQGCQSIAANLRINEGCQEAFREAIIQASRTWWILSDPFRLLQGIDSENRRIFLALIARYIPVRCFSAEFLMQNLLPSSVGGRTMQAILERIERTMKEHPVKIATPDHIVEQAWNCYEDQCFRQAVVLTELMACGLDEYIDATQKARIIRQCLDVQRQAVNSSREYEGVTAIPLLYDFVRLCPEVKFMEPLRLSKMDMRQLDMVYWAHRDAHSHGTDYVENKDAPLPLSLVFLFQLRKLIG